MLTINDLKTKSDVPVIIADQNGLITYINACFEKTFHWRAEELVEKSLTAIIPQELHDAHHLGFSRFIKTGTPTLLNKKITLKILMGNGMEVDVEHFIIADNEEGVWKFGAMISPPEGFSDG